MNKIDMTRGMMKVKKYSLVTFAMFLLSIICEIVIFNNHEEDESLKFFFWMLVFVGMSIFFTSKMNMLWERLCACYKRIPRVYIKAFLVILFITVLVFGFHIINFMFGNHDWVIATSRENLFYRNNIGRYGTNLIKQILFDNTYLPIISPLVALSGLSLTALLLSRYWSVPANFLILVLYGLIFTTNPMVLEWMFYVDSLPDFFVMPMAILSAFFLLQKIAEGDDAQFNKKMAGAILLLNFAISVYPACLSAIFIIFFGGLFFLSLNNHLEVRRHVFLPMLSIGAACLFFKMALAFLKFKGTLVDHYTVQSISLAELPGSVMKGIQAAFEQLIWYQFPFIPNFIAESFLVLLLMLVLLVLTNRETFKIKVCQIGIIFLMIMATKLAPILSGNIAFYEPRIDFFGLHFFYMFIVSALFCLAAKHKCNKVKSITTIICIGVIWVSCINDFNAQRIWHWGYETEKMTWNRIIDRIESLDGFDIEKEYDVVVIGTDKAMRPKFYEMSPKTYSSHGLLDAAYEGVTPLSAIKVFSDLKVNNIYVYDKVDNSLSAEHKHIIGAIYDTGELEISKAWPSNRSVWLSGNVLVIVFNQDDLDRVIADCSDLAASGKI